MIKFDFVQKSYLNISISFSILVILWSKACIIFLAILRKSSDEADCCNLGSSLGSDSCMLASLIDVSAD